MAPRVTRASVVVTALAFPVLLGTARIQGSTVFDAILGEPGQRTAEISTGELKRIIVFGSTMADARYVADAVAREAFHNVAFYRGSATEALAVTRR